jgi:hypothetical protein
MLSGPAASSEGTPPPETETLEDAFGDIVVVRGSEPMPVREQLPLTLPPQAADQLARQQAAQKAAQQQAAQQPGGPVGGA